jgi:hypothetical protein
MINAAQFKTKISPKGQPYGTTLEIIHQGLIRYDALINALAEERVSLLYSILKYARRYLAAHKGEKGYGKFAVGKSDKLLGLRRQAVNDLAADLLVEMTAVAPGVADALMRYDARKDAKGPAGGAVGFRTLAPGYANERETYVMFKGLRDEALKGKKFDSMFSNFRAPNPFAATQVKGNAPTAKIEESKLKNVAMRVDFENWTPKNFHDIGHAIRARQVQFFTKAERMKFALELRDDHLFYDVDGNLVNHTTQVPDRHNPGQSRYFQYMYAMDRYGNLYCREEAPEAQDEAAGYVNHSGFVAGREVICAGCISIVQGRLVHLDNNSGHYKPSRENLMRAIMLLWEEGADISETRVVIKGDGHTRRDIVTTAMALLNGREATVPYPAALAAKYSI